MRDRAIPPADCEPVDVVEAKLHKLADLLESKAREVLETDARIGLGTAKELALASIRARKQAGDLALAREDRAHSEWLIAEVKKLHGRAGPPRPPLRRKTTP
jgi:hypothetical protein